MAFWDRLLDTVKDVAPTLAGAAGTVLTGGNPAGGAALAALARKLVGASADEGLDSVAADILADPEKMMAFRIESRKLELEELRLRTLDVQDARKTLQISHGAVLISAIVVLGYFIATITVMTVNIPQGSQNIAYLLLGNLGTGFGMVLTFWLGSSVGSKEKDTVLARYADAAKADMAARQKGKS